jgi:hypothetical protein
MKVKADPALSIRQTLRCDEPFRDGNCKISEMKTSI